jgi:integrase
MLYPSFPEAIEAYLADPRRARLAPKTLEIDRERLKPLRRHFGGRQIDTITAEAVQAYQQARIASGCSGRTVNMETRLLGRVMKPSGLWEPLRDQVGRFPEDPRIPTLMDSGEKDRLFRIAKANRRWFVAYHAAIIASNTTCRKVELRHLRRGDVDFQNKLLRIRRTKGRTAGIRSIPMNAATLAAFRSLFRRLDGWGFSSADDWVFPGRDAKSRDGIKSRPVHCWRSAWRSLTEAAGLRGLRFHDLRHQAITELREAGTPDVVVMGISGHKSSAMLDLYSHARLDSMRSAVDRLEPAQAQQASPAAGNEVGALLKQVGALLSKLAVLLIIFGGLAQAQTFDPDPNEPGAQQEAELRALGAMLGMAEPPIGWDCQLSFVIDPRPDFAGFVCEPDPLLIEQQEREHRRWQRRLIENSRRNHERLLRSR